MFILIFTLIIIIILMLTGFVNIKL